MPQLKVPYSEFETLFEVIREHARDGKDRLSNLGVMQRIGYSADNTHFWSREGSAPLLAVNAARWIAASVVPPPPKPALPPKAPVISMTVQDLIDLLAAVSGAPVDPERAKALIKLLALMLVHSGPGKWVHS